MRPTPAPVPNARATRQSILSYLEGHLDLERILNVIGASGDFDAARRFVEEMQGFGDPTRRERLLCRLEDAA